jgi:putative membrane protein
MGLHLSHLRLAILALLGTYLFVYPFGILLIALDIVPTWGTWMGGALLILQGSMMGLWLVANHGRRGLLAALSILLISWAVEHVGVTTGFPFGGYHYTETLTLKVLGVVPLAVPFAWLMVVPAAVGITEYLLRRSQQVAPPRGMGRVVLRGAMTALGAASFALLLDLMIEPLAVHINGYWVWDNTGGGYYGVPGSNFAAWWVTSAVLAALMLALIHMPQRVGEAATETPVQGTVLWLPPLLYMLNLTMFVLIYLAHGKTLAVAVGSFILLFLGLAWLQPRMAAWIMGGGDATIVSSDRTPG